MKVAFVTFGCRLNRAESLDLEARYRVAILAAKRWGEPSSASRPFP